jgi:hypothetical protein
MVEAMHILTLANGKPTGEGSATTYISRRKSKPTNKRSRRTAP